MPPRRDCYRVLFGDGWHEKKTVFRLIHDVARTVGDLTSFDPRLNIERVLGIARDGSAAAHGDHLEADLDEVAKLLAEVMKFLDLDAAAIFQTNSAAAINLNKVSERAAKWAANPGRFEEWARLAAADREARASGPARIASTLASGRLEPKNAILEIETAFAEACWKKAIAGDPELSSFDGDSHAALVGRFRELEEKSREAAVRSVRAKHQVCDSRAALRAAWALYALRSAASAVTCRCANS